MVLSKHFPVARASAHRTREGRRRVSVALLAAALTAAVVAAGAPASAAEPAYCTSIVFIGVRGTQAPKGTEAVHSSRVWKSGGMGPQVAALVSKYKELGHSTYFVSLNYPAAGGTDYTSSVRKGNDTLVEELNWIAKKCTQKPRFILAGHSQGAQVVLDAISWARWPQGTDLSSRAKSSILAVAVFGDPTYSPRVPYKAPNAGTRDGLFNRNLLSEEAVAKYYYYTKSSGPAGSTKIYKVRSYCIAGDFFCQNNLGDSDFKIHNSYKTASMTAARDWLKFIIKDSSK